MKMTKERRQFLIKNIIKENEVETQEQLVELLNAQGMEITQATVSRDIKELHLAKVPGSEGKLKYKFIEGTNSISNFQKLQRKIQDVVVKIDCVNCMVLIKTLPGNAHVVGVLLDDMKWEEMLGCVCGNDTCLVICKTPEDATKLYERIAS